jgi:hypothetical protein
MIDIHVYTPRLWWRGAPAQIRLIVRTDPDISDGHQRHTDRDCQRWDLIAQAVAQVSRALAAGDWKAGVVTEIDVGTVQIAGGDLTDMEKGIVQAWFTKVEPVCADPWSNEVQAGRHRLWLTRDFFGDEQVPIVGRELGFANPAHAKEVGPCMWALMAKSFASHVEDLKKLDWFDRDDPVNRRYIDALETAARGEFP